MDGASACNASLKEPLARGCYEAKTSEECMARNAMTDDAKGDCLNAPNNPFDDGHERVYTYA